VKANVLLRASMLVQQVSVVSFAAKASSGMELAANLVGSTTVPAAASVVVQNQE